MLWSDKPKFMLSAKDAHMLNQIADALKERLEGIDAEVEALKARCAALESEVARLSAKPHQSLKTKLRARAGKEGA